MECTLQHAKAPGLRLLVWMSVLTLLWCSIHIDANDHDEVLKPLPANVKMFHQTRQEDANFWFEEAATELATSLAKKQNNNVAKNVIFFLGDGMSIATLTAARIYKGQQAGQSGEEYKLVWEEFPELGVIKTYDVNKQVPDSAATATAYLCGAKTNHQAVGVDSTVTVGDCTTVTDDNKLSSVAQWAIEGGKRAGVVTSTRLSHATPAVLYAHSATRKWECNDDIDQGTQDACPGIKDIALQLLEDYPGREFNVIMGGGYQQLSSDATDRVGDPLQHACTRTDGRNLFQEWQDTQASQGRSYAAVRWRSELQQANLSSVDYLMGIFANNHLPYEYEKREDSIDMPTLAEMTEAAITVLQRSTEGFFLLVEGGRIDMAHHRNQFNIALDETSALDDAVKVALSMVDIEDTLILVTSDHSHTTSISGYPVRGQDITGIAKNGDDGLPFTTLGYANGPSYYDSYEVSADGQQVVRRDISNDDVSSFPYAKPAGVPTRHETHGGDDVLIFATGPMAHLFQRTHEQSYIAHVVGYASCTGPNQDHCQ